MINSVAPSNEFTSRQILTFMNWIVSRWVFERQSGLYAIITSMSENTYYKEDGETVLSVEHVATLQWTCSREGIDTIFTMPCGAISTRFEPVRKRDILDWSFVHFGLVQRAEELAEATFKTAYDGAFEKDYNKALLFE
jgi:hypothetical protein